jgi:hypothetical protein
VEFVSGTLQDDGTGVFRIGNTPLVFTSDSRIVVDGKPAGADQLSDGLTATVMGRPAGDGFRVLQCTAAQPEGRSYRLGGDDGIEWSTEDPTVGSGRRPS